MDTRTALATSPADQSAVAVEHAVFTSIPSPMDSGGYRLVAGTRGLSPAERQEITRCAPSHGSLCDGETGAAGLASFPLESGRHCLLLACNAEEEHTGRGGCRVHTHVLVLTMEQFARFGHDPWRVANAAREMLGDNLLTKTEGNLEPLELSLGVALEGWPTRNETQQAALLLDGLLAERQTLLADIPLAEDLIRLALTGLPANLRSALSLSSGIKFTPKRAFQFVLLRNATSNEIELIAQNHGYAIVDAVDSGSHVAPAYGTWCDLAATRWQAGRLPELDALALRLDTAAPRRADRRC